MGSEGFIVLAVGLVIGYFIIKLFPKTKFGKKFMDSKDPRQRVLNNPDLLVKKLNENGKVIDDGKDMNYSVEDVNGERVVKLELGKERGKPRNKGPEKKTDSKKQDNTNI